MLIISTIIITSEPQAGALSPWLSGWRSAFKVRSQVWRGRPGRRLQSLGRPSSLRPPARLVRTELKSGYT